MSSEHRFEEIPEIDEMRERLLLGLELDENVDVAVRMRGVSTDRPEQREAPNAQSEDLGLDCLQASLHIGTGGGLGDHEMNLSLHVARARDNALIMRYGLTRTGTRVTIGAP